MLLLEWWTLSHQTLALLESLVRLLECYLKTKTFPCQHLRMGSSCLQYSHHQEYQVQTKMLHQKDLRLQLQRLECPSLRQTRWRTTQLAYSVLQKGFHRRLGVCPSMQHRRTTKERAMMHWSLGQRRTTKAQLASTQCYLQRDRHRPQPVVL